MFPIPRDQVNVLVALDMKGEVGLKINRLDATELKSYGVKQVN